MSVPRRAASLGNGRFALGSEIGRGAAGIVYDAFDKERGAHVALKMLRSVEPDTLVSFKTEFRAMHDLEHPNLVELGELFEDGGQWFFTMELVHGEGFLDHVREAGRLRDALLQLTRGLGALHAARIVHRDVKPSNVLVEPEGRVVLLDFGLATFFLRSGTSSDDGMRGTVNYMAPEQVMSEGVSPAADWYAVGVVLYQALTGQLPFTGTAHEVLEQKIGVAPRPVEELAPDAPRDLARLCAALLCTDPAQRATEEDVLRVLDASPMRAPHDSASHALPEEMVGRTSEVASLEATFAEVLAGQARSVVVHGESGVGKSFLVRTFCERRLAAQPETLILHGRCHERESVPYKAVDGAIDELARVLGELRREMLTSLLPDDVELVADLFPVLSGLREQAGRALQKIELTHANELRRRAFAALRELLARVARWRPLVLIVDDLQWADADSLALLHELMLPPSAPNLLLLCTRRVAAQTSATPQALSAGLAGEVSELALTKLPGADAAALVRMLLGASADNDAEVASIARESEGHPLFIAELVHQRRERVHGEAIRLDDALWARVEALPDASRAVLARVCVAGGPIPQEVAAQAAGLELGELFFLVAKLRAANLLRTAGVRRRDLVEPFHDRVRESVVHHLSDELRRGIHLQLAQAFESTGTDDPDALTMHWQGAGDLTRAASYAVQAGDRAGRALAFDRAVRFYQLARELRARPDAEETELLDKLAQALTDAGRGAESADVCLALAACKSGPDALGLRRLAAEQLMCNGHHDRGMALLRTLCAESGIYVPRSPIMVVLALLFVRVLLRLRGLRFVARDEASIDRHRLGRIDLTRSGAMGLVMTDHVRGAYFKTVNTLLALSAGEPRRALYALAMEAAVQSSGGARARPFVERLIQRTEQLEAESKVPEASVWLALARGYAAYFSHQLRRGRDGFARAEAAWQTQVGEKFHLASIRALLYRSLMQLGELRELAERIGPALRDVQARGDVYAEVSFRTTVTPLLALADDQPARARAEMAWAEPRLVRGAFLVQHYFSFISDLRIDLYEGRGRAAYERVIATWPNIRKSLLLHVEVVRHIALEHRARSALAAAAAGGPDAVALLADAEDVAGQLEREKIDAVRPVATMLRACVADARGQRDATLALLERAEAELARQELGLHLAAVQRRRGELIGGDAGAALITAAHTWLTDQGVRAPARLCATFYPLAKR